jgi:pimeloyl-ACP methyl ester carboxylesterase
MSAESHLVEIDGRKLEVASIAGEPERPTLVFLHEGLGSISLWRDFPARIAAATGCPAAVYSRYGYGQSDVLHAPFAVDYMHREALDALPKLLARLGIAEPILVGHSDGASIALIHAGGGHAVRALVVLAPHVFVEDLSVASIAEAKKAFETTDLPRRLARHHRDPTVTFYGWNDIWLHPDFRNWNITAYLPRITAPVLAVQGEDDEYGTMVQIDTIVAQVRGGCEVVALPACGHSPHRDQPERTVAAVADFVRRIVKS